MEFDEAYVLDGEGWKARMEDGSGRAAGPTEVGKWEVRKFICTGLQCKSSQFPNFSRCLHCLTVLNLLGSSKELGLVFSTRLQC